MDEKKIPHVMAVYLPQFHETQDNSAWWGEGFTDWDAVRQAEVCFEGHAVPWVPLENNYYDLSKIESLQWQADIAKKYGVDCFSFYHYYFKDGKMELEKPAELLLAHPEIDISFCFNWASVSWVRTWSKISGNTWSEKFEVENENNYSGILVEQDYGDRTNWEQHFNYLLPFFKDSRYYCIDEKPVFIFYHPMDITCIKEMIDTWNDLAIKEGLKGIYSIGVNVNATYYNLDASLLLEPKHNEEDKVIVKNGVRCFDYQDTWDEIISREGYSGVHTFYSGVSGYDDTPRRGKCGECLIHNTPKIFEDNLRKLMIKSAACGNEFLLINAWNEWGEGMYLEPDEQNGFAYLEAIQHIKDEMKEMEEIVPIQPSQKDTKAQHQENKQLVFEAKKFKYYTELYDRWLYMERKKTFFLEAYLQEQNVQSIAIYGMGIIGKQLYEQMNQSKVKVSFGIDRYVGVYGKDFTIYRPESTNWPKVDAIIIAAYDEDMSIMKLLKGKTDCKIITIDKIINDLWRRE